MNKLYRLIYWRTPWKTALVLTLLLFLEIGLLYRSIISVFAWSGLMVMGYFILLRAYTHFFPVHRRSPSQVDFDEDVLNIMAEVAGDASNDTPQSQFSMQTEEKIRDVINRIHSKVLLLRDMLLITNYMESLKLATFLYAMTYVGAHFNFLTLVILATVSTFTVPKIYETFQDQIDNVIQIGKNKVHQLFSELRRKFSQMPALQAILSHSQTVTPQKTHDNNQYKYH
jgi:reticulon-3